ncbi:MAG: hypothetical protein WCE53_06830 [Candidatus Acidiferrum sp.]
MFMGESYLGLDWRGMANLQRNEFSGEVGGGSLAWKIQGGKEGEQVKACEFEVKEMEETNQEKEKA